MRRTVAGIGRALVTLGLLILLFVGYQLWGTGIWTARAQSDLEKQFAKAQQAYDHTQTSETVDLPTSSTLHPQRTTTSTSPTRPAPPVPPEGDAIGWITIPHIKLHMIFVEGTNRDDLKKGPGHYPGTPLPGTLGNAAIAGHRTTYSHPFGDLDKMQVGNRIIIQTLAGTFTYKVFRPTGRDDLLQGDHWIVSKHDTWVVDPTADAELTLTSCHPKGSAEYRIVVKARLVANESAKPAKPRPPVVTSKKPGAQEASLAQGLSGQEKSIMPTIWWGITTLIIGLAWWWSFRRWRHPATLALGVVPFLLVLFPFYVYLERALPAGY